MSNTKLQYNIAAIRDLLLAAFTPDDLRPFCHDHPLFHPIINRFSPNHGLDDMVEEVITYCEKHFLFDQLLDQVRLHNPVQYSRCGPYRYRAAKQTNPPSTPIQVIAAVWSIALLTIAAFILWKQPFKPQPQPDPTLAPTSFPAPICAEQRQPPPTVGVPDLLLDVLEAYSKSTPPPSQIIVTNGLLVPVTVTVGGSSYPIQPMSEETLPLIEFPADVSWKAFRQRNSRGLFIGEEMQSIATNLPQNEHLWITMTVENQPYFYPIVTNNFDQNCAVTINEGLPNETRPCSIPAGAKTIGLGYYRWFPSSTIVFLCGNNEPIRKNLLPVGATSDPPYNGPHDTNGAIVVVIGPSP